MKRSAALTLLLLVAPALVRTAAACFCGANPPCAAVWRADAVFVGVVVERNRERVGGSLSWIVHKVAVKRVLRGSVDSLITFVPGGRPTAEEIAASLSSPGESTAARWDCDYPFQLGKEYVIYASRTADGRWTTGKCTGTKPIEEASADLAYIAGIPFAEPTGRVYGRIDRTIINPTDRSLAMNVPAPGVQVALVSGVNHVTVITDSDGKLDVHVPPGEYTIAPVTPQTIRAYNAPLLASVPARGCAPVFFSVIANGRIEGSVVRADGTPVAHTLVDVIPADLPLNQRPVSLTTARLRSTDEKGRFTVDAILPGQYVVAVNARFGPRLASPYLATYFPGVPRQSARVVEIAEGERKTGFTIVVSPLAETTLSGIVLFDDDRPAAGAGVTAVPVDPRGAIMSSSKTDSNGAFQLRVLTGITYIIKAGARTAGGLRQAETVVSVDSQKEDLRLSIHR
jgi:protocatechuate 3,4-dioxygenase beta subunit